MKLDKKDMLLYAVADRFLEEARTLKGVCEKFGVPFVINDNVDIAIASGAHGVHIGQEDMEAKTVRRLIGKDMILGVSVRSVEEAIRAERDGADYLGAGAVFHTDSKSDASYISREVLKDICSAVSIPVVAIGGINKENIKELSQSGISGAAVISALFAQGDLIKAAAELRKEIEVSYMKTALTIAGSDSSGGAGIQADIKTMTAYGVYAMSAVTALTAQNTLGVSAVLEVDPVFLSAQIDSVFTDIYPDSVKIGMVSSADLIVVISEKLRKYNARNIVLDPVMISTSGSKLLNEGAVEALKARLFEMADVITPNIPEASILSGIEIKSEKDMLRAAGIIGDYHGCAVLCKGGHSINDANDVLYYRGRHRWFRSERIENSNTHGTGCTLSSAIAAGLAKGMDLEDSIWNAKEYLSGSLRAMLDLGNGSGPLNHAWNISGKEEI